MSKMNEGYLCPECFLNLDSEAALLAHFEKKHGENLEQTTGSSHSPAILLHFSQSRHGILQGSYYWERRE